MGDSVMRLLQPQRGGCRVRKPQLSAIRYLPPTITGAASYCLLRLILLRRLAQLKWVLMLFGAVAQNVTHTTLSSRTEVSESRNFLKEWSQLSRLD